MQLRDYQLDLMGRVRQTLTRHQRVICQAPTGAGKTALAVYMMGRAAERGIGSHFVVHRGELMEQTSAALWEQGLQHGLIQSGRTLSRMPAQVASVQTLVRRLDRYEPPGLIIIDEAHRAAAATYQRVIEAYPHAKVVGLTATPQRTDGRGLDNLFGAIECGPPVRWLIDHGYLSDYRIFGPQGGAAIQMEGVRTRGGDYAKDDLAAAIDRPTITGDAVAQYKRHAAGKRAIAFCVTRAHSEHTAAAFRAAGVPAEHMDGETSRTERQAILGRLRSGKTLVLCNVELAVEGLDVPAVEALVMLRPTKSVIVHLQAIGRVMRPAPGKSHAIILDHVGNCLRPGLGLPDDEREWTLEGREKNARKNPAEPTMTVTTCKNCFAIFRPAPSCPSCGAPTGVKQREIEHVEGELVELDRDLIRREQKREQAKARDLNELIALGVRRQMRNPGAWAANVYCARQKRKPTPKEYAEASRIAREIRLEQRESA